MVSTYTNANGKSVTNEEVQTVIRVYPHILEYQHNTNSLAHITAERKCQTEVSMRPDQETKNFYSMLEYTPFQDIQESSIRTLNLPRKQKLQFFSAQLSKLHLGNCLYLDDDALSELCLDLRARIRSGFYKAPKTFQDREVQTEILVGPHILEQDKVATVIANSYMQTEGKN